MTNYRSLKLYGQQDKVEFYRGRYELLKTQPLPRRFVGKIRGRKGAQVYQSWHVGNLWQLDPRAWWEQYWGRCRACPLRDIAQIVQRVG